MSQVFTPHTGLVGWPTQRWKWQVCPVAQVSTHDPVAGSQVVQPLQKRCPKPLHWPSAPQMSRLVHALLSSQKLTPILGSICANNGDFALSSLLYWDNNRTCIWSVQI